MAKRLNKKVALIGLLIAVVLLVGAIAVFFKLMRDPEKFIQDGDAILAKIDTITDQELKDEEFKKAERNYLRARSRAKKDKLRIEILNKMVGLYKKMGNWENVMKCWGSIVSIAPENMEASFARLKYLYLMADSGYTGIWSEVESSAKEFIEIAENEGILDSAIGDLDPFKLIERPAVEKIGSFLYIARGKASFQSASTGAVSNPGETIDLAIGDFEKALEIEEGNVEILNTLARSYMVKGKIVENSGDFAQSEELKSKAMSKLEEAKKLNPDSVEAQIALLSLELGEMNRETVVGFETNYEELISKFPNEAQAYAELAKYYYLLDPVNQLSFDELDKEKNLDKAIVAIEKAMKLDSENVQYVLTAADFYYRRYKLYPKQGEGSEAEILKATKLAEKGLVYGDAQDEAGPLQLEHKRNRADLYVFLMNLYTDQVLNPIGELSDPEKASLISKAEDALYQIEQFTGSNQTPMVKKWAGMLELAKGNREQGIRYLYSAYEQQKASIGDISTSTGPIPMDAQLCYTLGKIFSNTSERGASKEFFEDALNSRPSITWTHPEAWLDYFDLYRLQGSRVQAVKLIDYYESNYGKSERSQRLRARLLIDSREFGQAGEFIKSSEELSDQVKGKLKIELAYRELEGKAFELANYRNQKKEQEFSSALPVGEQDEEDKVIEGLEDDLAGLKVDLAELVERDIVAASDEAVVTVCNNYVEVGEVEKARELIRSYIADNPDSNRAKFYSKLYEETDPMNLSPERRLELEKEVIEQESDSDKRDLSLGLFYSRNNKIDEALGVFKGLVDVNSVKDVSVLDSDNLDIIKVATGYLFDIYIGRGDFEKASKILDYAIRNDLDGVKGQYFSARLKFAQGEFQPALRDIDQCLEEKPIFSRGYLLRSNINLQFGNSLNDKEKGEKLRKYSEAVEDAESAARLNPKDSSIVKALAFAIYNRNDALDSKVTPEQKTDAQKVFLQAVSLSTGSERDRLLGIYSGLISADEPFRALAIRQQLQSRSPSIENVYGLANIAARIGFSDPNESRKVVLLDLAQKSYEQAIKMDPGSNSILSEYSGFLRKLGKGDEAKEMLKGKDDVLWRYYLSSKDFAKAKEILEKLHLENADGVDTLKGLILVCEGTFDRAGMAKYTEELISQEQSNVDYYLYQIQEFLKLGMVKEAGLKIEGFVEKYPDESRIVPLQAWHAMRQGKLKEEEALELANKNLQSEQNDPDAWKLRGEVNFQMRDYVQAISDFAKSMALTDEQDPSIGSIQLMLAKSYWGAKRSTEAISELKRMISNKQISNDPKLGTQAKVLLESIYKSLGRVNELEDFYDQVMVNSPDNLNWYDRAGSYAIEVEKYDRAEKILSKGWSKNQELGNLSVSIFGSYLLSLTEQGKYDKVLETARDYVDGGLRPVAYYYMGRAKAELGDKTVSMDYFKKAIEKTGTNDLLSYKILEQMKEFLGNEVVSDLCNDLLRESPSSVAANLNMYNLARSNGEYNKALEYVDKCISLSGSDSGKVIQYILNRVIVLQLAYNKTSDKAYLTQAIEEYESLLVKLPNNLALMNNLAYMLAENNERLEEALDLARRAYQISPNNPVFMDTYAFVLFKTGSIEDAYELLQAAKQQYDIVSGEVPGDVYEHLGMVSEEKGDNQQALEFYKLALEKGKDELSEKVIGRIREAIERLSK